MARNCVLSCRNSLKNILWKCVLEGISLKHVFLQISLQGRCKFAACKYFSGLKLWFVSANCFSPNVVGLNEIWHSHTNTCDNTVLMIVTSYPVAIRLHNLTNLESLIIAVVLLQLFQNKETFYIFHASILSGK